MPLVHPFVLALVASSLSLLFNRRRPILFYYPRLGQLHDDDDEYGHLFLKKI